MFGFGHIGRKRQQTRRLLAAVGVSLLLSIQAFATIYIVHEADHHCCGEHCQTCLQLHNCIEYFQLTGSGIVSEPLRLDVPMASSDFAPATAIKPPHITLVSLNVRMDE